MKKLLSLILCLAILFTGAVVIYAEGTSGGDGLGKIKEIRQLISEARSNSAKITELKQDAKENQKIAKSKVKELINNKDNLTDDQLKSLTEAIKLIKQDRSNISGAIKLHNSALITIRTAKRSSDLEKVRGSLINLNKVQKEAISKLSDLIENLNKISGI